MLSGNEDSCKLLGPISLLIQVIMGGIAVGVLLIKRHYEHPKRTWIVWSYDLGKQVLGSLGVHFFNVLISVTKAGGLLMASAVDDMKDDDQCDWFFLNLLMDTTIGIPILWLWLRIIHIVLVYFAVSNIESGNYYPDLQKDHDPSLFHNIPKKRPLFSAFLKQLLAFLSGLLLMKCCILLILNYFESTAAFFANIVLGWADPWPNFQVFLVMFVAPVALNCFQYLCIDNIIKLSADPITEQNVDNFDQESIIQENGIYVTNYTNNHKLTYGAL